VENGFSFTQVQNYSTHCTTQSVFIENEIYEKGVDAKIYFAHHPG
jgi:hypothetical protein